MALTELGNLAKLETSCSKSLEVVFFRFLQVYDTAKLFTICVILKETLAAACSVKESSEPEGNFM